MAFKFCFFLCLQHFLLCELPWGTDASLHHEPSSYTTPKKHEQLMGKSLEKIILFHQNVISPVDGPRSHFRPTSARYMLLSLRRHGVLKGVFKGCDRLLRENNESWVYRTKIINGVKYRWDPTYK